MHCHSCDREMVRATRFCPHCGVPLTPDPTMEDAILPAGETAIPPAPVIEITLTEGEIFADRYRIEREIGRDGLSVRCLAEDTLDNTPVCLRLIHSHRVSDPGIAERFRKAGAAALELRHPGIVPVFDVNRSAGIHYLSMEHVEGRSLESWLSECVPQAREMPLATAVGILLEILVALEAAHSQGVLHLDLGPSDVILLGDPAEGEVRLKIRDFGIARSLDDPLRVPHTHPILGTPPSMAPELRTAPETVGPETDVFAVGAILYQMLMQVPPEGRWELPSEVRGDVPDKIDGVLMRALNPHPSRRFAGAGEMAAAARAGLKAAPGRFGYSPAELERFEKLLATSAWRARRGRRNAAGMLVAVHERTGLEFVLVPEGRFAMGLAGSADAEPVHEVDVDAFLLCTTPCTQEAWDRVGGPDGRRYHGPELPIEGVSYEGVKVWLDRAGAGLRLPSESEWEYACRSGTGSAFCFGDEEAGLGEHGWSQEISGGRTHPVGTKLPNAWGILDAHGNVWEWCEDAWHSNYDGAPSDGAAWIEGGEESTPGVLNRVGRGGSWRASARSCRSGGRSRATPDARGGALGFRPAASLEP